MSLSIQPNTRKETRNLQLQYHNLTLQYNYAPETVSPYSLS